MTQLTDDCFAHGGQLMPLDEAIGLIRERIHAVTGTEQVELSQALDRYLAEDVESDADVPPHDNAAVDGYAVYFDDLNPDGETRLPIRGRVTAGHPLDRPAWRGDAIQILTGAPIPAGESDAGPDTVLMQEDCRVVDDHVVIPHGIPRGANWRARGEDIKRGTRILRAGRKLRPADLGLAASIGHTSLAVQRPLRAALFSTGDEIREPGTPLPSGAVYDANRYTLYALLTHLQCQVSDLGIIPDDPAQLNATMVAAMADHDILVSSGGVSTGTEDHVKPVIEALGDMTFWRLAIKPGRPLALGMLKGDGRRVPFVGLPGNPAAVMVTALRVLRPLILRMSGCSEIDPVLYPVRAGFDHGKKPARREFVRCRLEPEPGDLPVAVKSGRQGAGILSGVAAADGLVELPEDMTDLKRGTTVEFLPFAGII